MTIRTANTGEGEVTILLNDTFDFSCVEAFRNAYEGIDHEKKHRIIVDFESTQYMDSSALGMLINMEKYCKSRGGTISLVNPNPQLKKIFMISRFDKKFSID